MYIWGEDMELVTVIIFIVLAGLAAACSIYRNLTGKGGCSRCNMDQTCSRKDTKNPELPKEEGDNGK